MIVNEIRYTPLYSNFVNFRQGNMDDTIESLYPRLPTEIEGHNHEAGEGQAQPYTPQQPDQNQDNNSLYDGNITNTNLSNASMDVSIRLHHL